MRRHLLTLIAALLTTAGINAQTFDWGTASWNIEDGKTYQGIEELNADGVVLTYSNPNNYVLTFLNIISIDYDLFIDDATEAIKTNTTAQSSTAVPFNYPFVEGHKYKIVTTKSTLVAANLATFTTDTVSQNDDSYTISFTIEGPELVKTIDVEASQSLSITDQSTDLTVSAIDTKEIINALGIKSISEATIYGLNLNGSYNTYFGPDWYDGWRDADGEYTTYSSGWDRIAGRNAAPAVYSIKLTQNADSVLYFFYDYWSEYTEDTPDVIDGSTVSESHRRVPNTSYNYTIWEWDNGDGTVTKYRRAYRVNEGEDYKASFAIIANKKYVLVNATLHFISQEEYAKLNNKNKEYNGFVAIGTSIAAQPGTPVAGIATSEQTVSVSETDAEGKANVTFSGFSVAIPPLTIENLTIPVSVSEENGVITYTTDEAVPVSIPLGNIDITYYATLRGEQTSADSAPVFVLTLSQASIITVVFNSTSDLATERANLEYSNATSIAASSATANIVGTYSIDGISNSKAAQGGIKVIKYSDGTIRKVFQK